MIKTMSQTPSNLYLRRVLRLSFLQSPFPKLNTHTINAMPLIRRCIIPLALKYMSKMSPTICTHNLRPTHPKSAIFMSYNGTWYRVEKRRPAAAGFEFVGCFIKRGVTAGAGVDAVRREVLVVFAAERRLGSLFAEDSELF